MYVQMSRTHRSATATAWSQNGFYGHGRSFILQGIHRSEPDTLLQHHPAVPSVPCQRSDLISLSISISCQLCLALLCSAFNCKLPKEDTDPIYHSAIVSPRLLPLMSYFPWQKKSNSSAHM